MISIIILLTSVGSLVLGLVVYKKDPKNYLNILFGIFAFLMSLWVFSNFLLVLYKTPFLEKLSYALGALLISGIWVWFYELCRGVKPRMIVIAYSAGFLFAVLSMIDGIFFEEFTVVSEYGYEAVLGPAFSIFAIYTIFAVLYSVYLILTTIPKVDSFIRKKLLFVFWGMLLFALTALTVSFILPLFGISSYSMLDSPSSSIFVILSAYAMIKYGSKSKGN